MKLWNIGLGCPFLVLCTTLGAMAAPTVGQADSGVSLIPASAWKLADSGYAAPLQTVPAGAGEPFAGALRVNVLRDPDNTYDSQLTALTAAPVADGDACVCTFYARCTKALVDGVGTSVVSFQLSSPPWTNSLNRQIELTNGWRKFTLPFIAGMDYAAGGAQLNFELGFGKQTVEIANISVVDYGSGKTLADLPSGTPATYGGRGPDAAWRKAALRRIDKIRDGDLVVRVVDARGRPLANVHVDAKLTKRAFRFGNDVADQCVSTPDSQTADSERWRKEFLRNFDGATLGLVTWRLWESPEEHSLDIASAQWLKDHGYDDIHGAHLMWTHWDVVPAAVHKQYLATVKTDPARARRDLQSAILAHIRDIVPKLRGTVTLWNVINEQVGFHEVGDAAGGVPAMAEWFRLAHQLDPKARLIINDYDILSKSALDVSKQDRYFDLIKSLMAAGAPVQGIGFQCHFNSGLPAPPRVLAVLDRFATLGVPIYVTEFDVTNMSDAALQGDFTRDFLITVYSHPAVAGFTMWDFWDGNAWRGNGPLFYKNWSLKPSGQAFEDLANGAWRASPSMVTNSRGLCHARTEIGQYMVTVVAPNGARAAKPVAVTSRGTNVTIKLGSGAER